jgi:O-antigen/teichoic acid export membrane protein
MRSSAAWRRSFTAASVYVSAAVGFLGTVIVSHELTTREFGLFAIVVGTTSVFQLIGDVTVDEALIKYGARYETRGDWGRFRRIFEVGLGLKLVGGLLGGLCVLLVVPFASSLFEDAGGIGPPLAVAALLPLAQSPEGVAASLLLVRGRYDLRAGFLVLSMALRLAGLAAGASVGLTGAILGMVVAQVVASAAICVAALVAFARVPRAAAEPLGEHRPEFRRFVVQSSVGSLISPLRGTLAFPLLGLVASPAQVGYFRAAQAPQTAFATLSAPLRLMLIAEQTHEFERGNVHAVYRLITRYILGAAALMAVLVPVLWILMPWLVRLVYPDRLAPATDAARLILLAAAVGVVWGWTKWFPVAVGRPALRIWTHAVEIAVLVPTLLVLGARYGATGAAGAVAIAAAVVAVLWVAILVRMRRAHLDAWSRKPDVSTGRFS